MPKRVREREASPHRVTQQERVGGHPRPQPRVDGRLEGAPEHRALGAVTSGDVVKLDGDVVFNDVLELEVGGSVAGEESDQLIFHGTATLGGTLRITWDGQRAPMITGPATFVYRGEADWAAFG